MSWTAPRDWSSGETVDETIMDTHIKDNLTYLHANMPARATMFHKESLVTVGNGLTTALAPTQYHTSVSYQSAAADGDTFTQSFVMIAGTYSFVCIGQTRTAGGIIDWDLDGTGIVTGQDWYSGVNTANVIKTVAAITVVGNGRHVLTGTVNGQNGSSSDYVIYLTKMYFLPGSD